MCIVGHASSIDVILTNKKRSFRNSSTLATGVSDFHKMVLTTTRSSKEHHGSPCDGSVKSAGPLCCHT